MESVPWHVLPADVVRIMLRMLASDETRAHELRFKDFAALKNACRAFGHAAEQLEGELLVVREYVRAMEEQRLRLKAQRSNERREARRSCCNSCGMVLLMVFCCPCVFCIAPRIANRGRPYAPLEDDDTPALVRMEDGAGGAAVFEPRRVVAGAGPSVAELLAEIAAAAPVPPDERKAREWRETAALEHRSVSSFALHAQRLLSAGLPCEAAREALACAAEEVGHYELARAMAVRCGAPPFAAAPQLAHSARLTGNARQLLCETAAEGCAAETLAALECARQADATALSALEQRVWRRIAAEEGHHAAFAWRTARFLVAQEPALAEELRATVRSALHFQWTPDAAVVRQLLEGEAAAIDCDPDSAYGLVLSTLQ